jgi:hypothetical protein
MGRTEARRRDRVEFGLADGATVSGDTTGIVVVKTDPGYGPLPTEHGTGTVVASAC